MYTYRKTDMKITRLKDLTKNEIDRLMYRFGDDFNRVITDVAAPICEEVHKDGDAAVKKYTAKFDRVELSGVTASKEEIEQSFRECPKDLIAAFEQAITNIREFHAKQRRENIDYTRPDGSRFGMLYQPIDSAALYVPGGTAAYPSSVMMCVIPAQLAGVKNISLITPPAKNGSVPLATAAVCRMLNVETIVKSGGAQGIAAAGFGTASVPKAELVVGPGNIYVTAAKSYLFSRGVIQIDSLAGPSEMLVVADAANDPEWLAYDMLSQAEHDPRSIAILVTDNREFAEKVVSFINADLAAGGGRHEIKVKAIENSEVVVTDTIEEAIDFASAYGPEHMQLMVEEPMRFLDRVRNVGSLFIGPWSPVAVGDYISGTNHILPTGGAARFSSGLSVETFLRRTSWQNISREGLQSYRKNLMTIARAEGFDDKHGGSVEIRFSK